MARREDILKELVDVLQWRTLGGGKGARGQPPPIIFKESETLCYDFKHLPHLTQMLREKTQSLHSYLTIKVLTGNRIQYLTK